MVAQPFLAVSAPHCFAPEQTFSKLFLAYWYELTSDEHFL